MSNLTRPAARPRAGRLYDWDTEPTGTWPDTSVDDDRAPLWSGLLQGVGLVTALAIFTIGALGLVVANGWGQTLMAITLMAVGLVIAVQVCAVAHAEQTRDHR